MAVTAAQRAKIREQLFLVQGHTELTLPSNSADANGIDDPVVKALDTMMDGLRTASPTKFADLGVGVVDFTKDPKNPKIWLYNGGTPWRIASTGKVSVLLSAVQLRDDVRLVKEVTGLTDAKSYDDLFADPDLWQSKNAADVDVQLRNAAITGQVKPKGAATAHCPRPSAIFDLTKDPVDFHGPLVADAAAKAAIAKKLGWKPGVNPPKMPPHLKWGQVAKYDFSELLWMMGDLSDNVAATACMSEIGLAYIKSVQRAYGLFQEAKGAHLLIADGYDAGLKAVRIHGAPSGDNLRPLTDVEHTHVQDALAPRGSTKYTDQSSTEPGSATALAAYLIALMQNRFVSSRNSVTPGKDNGALACETIRQNLSSGLEADNGGVFPGTQSTMAGEIAKLATITRRLSKIGLLNEEDGTPPPGFSCEFLYVETQQSSGKKLQYGVVVTGMQHPVEPDLAPKIHQILLAS